MIIDVSRTARELFEADPTIVVFVAHRGPGSELDAAVGSIAMQRGVCGRLAVVVGEDGSPCDGVLTSGRDVPGALVRCSLQAGTPAAARNDLLDVVRRAAPRCETIVRLDSDDRLASPSVLAAIERRARRLRESRRGRPVEALLFGNLQTRNGVVLPRPNLPGHEILTRGGLLERLAGMADGDPAAELPSCNLVLLRGSRARFPNLPSAEDHALVAALLVRGRVATDDSIIQTIYRLGGNATAANLRNGVYRESRRRILEMACGA